MIIEADKLWFRRICRTNGINVTDAQASLLEHYVACLLEWNKKINLISRQDEDNVWRRHIFGSIAFLRDHRLRSSTLAVDVGTGGGLPGIPIAILSPQIEIVLLDSIQKKMHAVREMVSALKLDNVKSVVGRAEEVSAQNEYQRKFDYVVVRAVGSLNDIIRWSRAFLKPGDRMAEHGEQQSGQRAIIPTGSLVVFKGGDLTEEINIAMTKARPKNIEVTPIVVDGVGPDDLADKKLVVIQP